MPAMHPDPRPDASLTRRRAYPRDATLSTWTAGDGWTVRRFDRAGGGRGAILFAGGRGDVIEKYLESFADWHDRGWSVTAFDWRGQGGSGRLSSDRHVGHVSDFGIFIDDLAGFWRDWQPAQTGPCVAIGHSMGGHLVLRALMERAIDADAAVLVAPMLGLRSPIGARLGGRVAALLRSAGDPARAAWKGHERPGARLDRQALLTHDRARYEDEAFWLDAAPDLRLGPPSWAWLAEAFASTAAMRADPRLREVTTPVQLLIAGADRLVAPRAAVEIAARLPNAEVVRFGLEAAHEILREADPVRRRALAAIDAFLDARAPRQ